MPTIPTLVKDDALVAQRRRQIADAAVALFCETGYHQTTTRQIARAAGLSIGALYEYVAAKGDVLYLVCDAIHAEMTARLDESPADAPTGREALEHAIAAYFRACDTMQEGILLIYRETASLDGSARRQVLANDEQIAQRFAQILERGRGDGSLRADPHAIPLMAHNIVVLGHMWAFRRWSLKGQYTLADYTGLQTALLMNELGAGA